MSRNSCACRMLCELDGKMLRRLGAKPCGLVSAPTARPDGPATIEPLEPRLLLSSGPVAYPTVTVDEGQVAINAGAFDDFEFNEIVTIEASVGTVTSPSVAGFVDSGQSPAAGLDNRDVGLGDLDGDGDLDAFIVNWGTFASTPKQERVWLNDGAGTFTDSGQLLGNSQTYRVTLGDVDDDGDLDAMAATVDGAAVWLNDGAANFTAGQFIPNAKHVTDVGLGDLDRDGDLDAFLAVRADSNEIWLNDGSGTFTDSGIRLGGTAWSYGVELADLDGDLDLDALVANLQSGQNYVYLNELSGDPSTFVFHQIVGGKSDEAVLGDLDGDFDLDVFIPYTDGPNEVWLNDGAAGFTNSGQSLGGTVDSRDVALVDVDYDGDLDAFVANRPADANTIWLNNGAGSFTDSGQALGSGDSRDIEMGDLDGDGDPDAFVANAATDSTIWLNESPWSWSLATTDGPDQSQTVAITATDGTGATDTTTFELVVSNVAPTFEAGPNETLPEGIGAFSRTGIAFVDPGAETWTGTVNWGDSPTSEPLPIDPSAKTFDLGHTYTAAGTYTVTVTIDDGDGGSHTDTFDVDVSELVPVNTPPTVNVGSAAVTVDEGDTAGNSGTFDDVNPGDNVIITASVGTITQDTGNSGNWNWSLPTTDGPDQSQSVTITADDGTDTVTTTFSLTVDNVAPTFGGAAFEVEENSPNGTVVGTVTATDPGDDTLTYAITTEQAAFAIDPDTGQITVADAAQLDFETTASFVLEVQVTDGDPGGVDAATVTIDLLNQASITGVVFLDVNANGLYEADEPGINGVTIELLDENGAPVMDDQGAPVTAVTSDGGYYLFEDLAPATYQVHEIQPTGVDDGTEILGSLGGSVTADDTMQLNLSRVDAADYVFAEFGQQVTSGDAAGGGFWQNKHGQALIRQGGTALANWLTINFANVFGDTFVGADGDDVATFYKDQLFRQKGKKSAVKTKVDARFMAVALAAYFTSSNLAGDVAAGYGFNVTDTGIGTSIVNVGSSGAAFSVADDSDQTIMQLLQATDSLTDLPDGLSGFAHIYDQDGDGTIDASERVLRTMASDIYATISDQGGF